jgi:hypothetical protein
MRTDSEMIAMVLRSYCCEDSERFAYWLQERLDTRHYGNVHLDPNDELSFTNPDRWREEFKEFVAQGRYMIALLSPKLNEIDDTDDPPGIALVSEILYFWSQHQNDPGFPSHLLIPIYINCSSTDLARPLGEYEQLKDIVVPYLASLNPMQISTPSFYDNVQENFEFSDAIAARLGIQPRK